MEIYHIIPHQLSQIQLLLGSNVFSIYEMAVKYKCQRSSVSFKRGHRNII